MGKLNQALNIILIALVALLACRSVTSNASEDFSCGSALVAPLVGESVLSNTERVIQTYLKAHLDETERLFQRIVADYPMETHEYVFVGRSPTLLAAVFDIYKSHYSKLRAWVLPVSLKNKNEVGIYELMDRFDLIFNGYRQQPVEDSRKLVFIDTVADGRTFKVLDRLLSVTRKSGEFVGFTQDTMRAENVLKHWRLQSAYRLYPVSVVYTSELGLLKNLSPYEAHALDSADYPLDPVVPGPVRPLYRDLLQTLLKTGEF